MTPSRLLLLLLVLSTAKMGLSFKMYNAESLFSCLSSALSQAKQDLLGENSALEKRTFVIPLEGEDTASFEDIKAEKEKRTFPAVTRYVSLAQAKGKTSHSQAKNDRRAKFTLSLDVPTNLMNILFNIAKAKNLRAKAASNAQLMAQVGRRK
ncbi:urocortin-3 [Python bivittatus]|uniref:Urocortin-3 n=1 Tax=Python bivittatus TaxID=176946 RepID=A0A9F5JA83_PYTBI|nr:urocortin-3 [Python bivittatus]XP_025030644.1 urocortin-3 [Python bivittatus]